MTYLERRNQKWIFRIFYKVNSLKGYDFKVSYTTNHPFSKKGLEGALKKVGRGLSDSTTGKVVSSSPGEEKDICRCVVPLRHQGTTLNSHRVASLLVWLGEREEKWEAPGFSPSKLGWNRAKSYCHLQGAQRC
ncbi:hypothetical protein TNCV_3723411 [Trichonephila clavipes]|nr:hypothetical protein TNCV_3723411 [Trichonephila clavipes]